MDRVPMTHITVGLPVVLLRDMDILTGRLSKEAGRRIRRSDIVRIALEEMFNGTSCVREAIKDMSTESADSD